MTSIESQALVAIERCRELARLTDIHGQTTRTFLSPAMRRCMEKVQGWMEAAGMPVSIDAAGNVRGIYQGEQENAPCLVIGSHLDTVPNAGAFDGILGVMIGLALIEGLHGGRMSFSIELIGFSEEEGIRFRLPFVGSRALTGKVDDAILARKDVHGISVKETMQGFGLNPEKLAEAILDERTIGYLEFHIEQGCVLESKDRSLGVVEAIAGQTRGEMTFFGSANHAGTTPMHLRKDALAAAAQWICEVERIARETEGLVATVGRLTLQPGAVNVIAGEAGATLDIRHAQDSVRQTAAQRLIARAEWIAEDRGMTAEWRMQTEQAAVWMDADLTRLAADAVRQTGIDPLPMVSGAGHDAMILAERVPSTMIFLRSPGGISHNPSESVRPQDVENALAAGYRFLEVLDTTLIEKRRQVQDV